MSKPKSYEVRDSPMRRSPLGHVVDATGHNERQRLLARLWHKLLTRTILQHEVRTLLFRKLLNAKVSQTPPR